MTRKLYYEDCHLCRFEAKVTGCEKREKGYEVLLDATAFYPEGGGQACDLGTLGNAKVLDVRERGEAVVHLCDAPLETGSVVAGVIDYERRFDLMQQHSGEHIVSGIIHRRYGFHNVGFHMGSEMTEIDFDGMVPAEDLPDIEQEANHALWQDLVKLFSVVPLRGGCRIEMSCGARALRLLNRAFEQNRQVSQAFSAKWMETADAARKMNETLAKEKLRGAQLQKQIFENIAGGYKDRGDVLHFEPGLEPVEVRICGALERK